VLLVVLLVLADRFGEGDLLPVLAVAAAYSLSQYVHVAQAWYRLRKDTDIDFTPLRASLIRSTAAALAGGAAAAVIVLGAQALLPDQTVWWATLALVLISSLVGVATAAAVELTDPKVRPLLVTRLGRRHPTMPEGGDLTP